MGRSETADVASEIAIADRATLATRFVAFFETCAGRAIARYGRFLCAIPGGSVAETFLPALVGARVDWSRIDVFWTDERAVPPEHPDSNYGRARRLFLDDVPIPPARVHRMPGDARDLEAAAAVYAQTLTATREGRSFDLVLLGMGPDGHVCSLFPGHPLLEEATATVRAILDAPKSPPHRLTLTLPALAGTGHLVVAAFGEEKAVVARAALTLADPALPVVRAARAAVTTVFLLDDGAAAGLGRR